MDALSLAQFSNELTEYDSVVSETPEIDHFCSSSYWILPAYRALTEQNPLIIRRSTASDGYVALTQGRHESVGYYLQPLEASWGLASPVIGANPRAVAREFCSELKHSSIRWNTLFLTGVHKSSPQFIEFVQRFQKDHFVGIGPKMTRQFASLEGGFEAFFERRSSKFRRNIEKAQQKADDRGLQFEFPGDSIEDSEDLYEEIMAIEQESWKGREQAGITQPPMRDFYQLMLRRLVRDDALRIGFAAVDGERIAYCFGGIFNNTYRGLQMSYHDDYSDLAPGNLLQIELIKQLCDEGIRRYDMGQAMEYKSRWTEKEFTTVALVIRK